MCTSGRLEVDRLTRGGVVLLLRGNTEWNGDWSDADEAHWTRRARAKLSFRPEDGDDG